jgi:hypothetical protein
MEAVLAYNVRNALQHGAFSMSLCPFSEQSARVVVFIVVNAYRDFGTQIVSPALWAWVHWLTEPEFRSLCCVFLVTHFPALS